MTSADCGGSSEIQKHDYALLSDFISGDWRVDCSCGWTGPDRRTVGQAARDAESHREEVER